MIERKYHYSTIFGSHAEQYTASGSTQQSGMEGKLILDAEGYNDLFTLPLASVSCLSVQIGIQGKKKVHVIVHKC